MRLDDTEVLSLTMSPAEIARYRLQQAIKAEFNLEASRIAASLILEAKEHEVDVHEALAQLKKNLPIVVAEELAKTERIISGNVPRRQQIQSNPKISWWRRFFGSSKPALA